MAGSNQYKNQWISEKLDRINLTVEKGKKDIIRAYAESCGESVNALINRAINSVLDEESTMSVFDRLHKERNFFEWYHFKATEEEKLLAEHVMEYSEEYFSDFRFEPESIVSDYISVKTSGDDGQTWFNDDFRPPYAFIEYFDQLVLESIQYIVKPMEDDCEGMFNSRDFSIFIPPRNLDNKPTILHESIHLHEAVIDQTPKFYHDILLLCLYNDLRTKIKDLDSRILEHTHVYFGDQITTLGGDHDVLFFLKSLDLDLRCGYKLGTVCGYGRDEFQE